MPKSRFHSSFIIKVWAKTLLLFLLPVFSCTDIKKDQLTSHYSENLLGKADSLAIAKSHSAAFIFLDSAYAAFPYISVTDKYQYYLFKTNYLEPDSALIYADSMILLIEKNNLESTLDAEYAQSFKLKGEFCLFLHKYTEASAAISMCKFLSEKGGDTCVAGDNTATLGLIDYQQLDFYDAVKHFKEAIQLFSHCKNDKNQFYRMQGHLDNLGLSYSKIGQYDSAQKYYEKAALYIEQNKELYKHEPKFPVEALTVVNGNIAGLYSLQKDYGNAEKYIKKNIAINTGKMFDSLVVAQSQIALSGIYLDANRIDDAENMANQAKGVLPSLTPYDNLSWLKIMSRIAAFRKNESMELTFLKQYYTKRDSINEKAKEILGMNPASEFDRIKKKYDLDLLKKNNRIQQLYILTAVVIGLLLIILILMVLRNLKRSRKSVQIMKRLNSDLVKREEQLQELMLEQEKRRKKEQQDELFFQEVRLQIEYNESIVKERRKISDDMHDELSSSLAALKYYIEDQKNKATDNLDKEILADLSEEVRSIYENARRYMHNLKSNTWEKAYDLVFFLTDISQKFSEKTYLTITIDIDKYNIENSLLPEQHDQLYHIIRESISNVLKHAAATELAISIKFYAGNCRFIIADNGTGFKKDQVTYGIGLKSIRKRIEELNGRLEIESLSTGTTLMGLFPLGKKNDHPEDVFYKP